MDDSVFSFLNESTITEYNTHIEVINQCPDIMKNLSGSERTLIHDYASAVLGGAVSGAAGVALGAAVAGKKSKKEFKEAEEFQKRFDKLCDKIEILAEKKSNVSYSQYCMNVQHHDCQWTHGVMDERLKNLLRIA